MRSVVRLPFALLVAVMIASLAPLAVGAGNPNRGIVWFSPASGPVGTTVSISGTGWRKHRGQQVTLAMCTPGAPVVATATVDRDGTFAFPPVVIPSAEHLHWNYNSWHCVFTIRNSGSINMDHWWYVTS